MQIMLDGLNIGLKQGAGLASYARGVQQLLINDNHDTNILYGHIAVTQGYGLNLKPTAHAFFQSLALGKQKHLGARKLIYHLSTKTPLDLLQQTIHDYPQPLLIQPPAILDLQHCRPCLPAHAKPYNLPLIFERAYAYFRITGRLLKFKADQHTDIYHSTFPFPLIAANKPNVCTFHDLIPLALPGMTETDLSTYRRLCNAMLRECDVILCDSKQTIHDIIQEFNVHPDKLILNYLHTNCTDLAQSLTTAQIEACLKRHGLQKKHYLLYVGTLEPRKNLVRLIRAYIEADTQYPLVIVGKEGWLYHDIRRAMQPLMGTSQIPGKQIIRLNYLPENDVIALIAHARMLLFPSLYEGFGLPVLEAMSLGCPVITSNLSSLPEISGSGAVLVNPYQISDISQAITQLCRNDALRDELIAKGLQQAKRFTKENSQRHLLAAYKLAINLKQDRVNHVISIS